MTEEQITPPAEADNGAEVSREIPADIGTLEDAPPSEEDNGDDDYSQLKGKVEDQRQKLAASKAEALRLKNELEAIKTATEAQDDETPANLEEEEVPVESNDYVTNKEVDYKKREQVVLNAFLDKHPEYEKKNDPNDKRWTELMTEINTFYRSPSDPNNWKKILDKAHKDISKGNELLKGKALAKAEANLSEQAKLGGGSSGGSSTPKEKKSPDQQSISEGFATVRPKYYKD